MGAAARLPDLDCLEYLFDVDGTLAPDPGNPDRVEGAFGPHSWLAMPGYHPPAWVDVDGAPGRRHRLAVGEIDVEVWEPTGHEDGPLPLLLVHDGAEMDEFGRVVQYAATRAPMRVALLSPGSNRDERYAANPAYAAALVGEVIPALPGAFPTTTSRCCSARASAGWRRCTRPGCTRAPSPGWSCSRARSSPRAGPAGVGLRALRPGRRVRRHGA